MPSQQWLQQLLVMAGNVIVHRSGRMTDRLKYKDHLIAGFIHTSTGEEFTVVRAQGRNGKFKLHASWRCRGINFDAAKAWVDEQSD